MTLRIVIRPAAVIDISEQHAFIAGDNPRAAERFVDAIDATLERLSTHPEIGRACEFRSPTLAAMRQFQVQGFRWHLLFYRAVGRDLILERVLHAARDIPGLIDIEENE